MIDRRSLLGNAALLASAGLMWGRVAEGAAIAGSPLHHQILSIVAGLVIPKTDTPGAIEVGVPAFVLLALQHGLEGTRDATTPGAPAGNDYLAWLEHALGKGFLHASRPKQLAALTALDNGAFAQGALPSPWRSLKTLILIGYYTSEVGASRELQYQLVPGRWDPDVPLKPHDRAWSSDWTAVDFG